VASIGSEDVAVEMLACPINPSDINIIQGSCKKISFLTTIFLPLQEFIR
jgi:NADPH:quinone reductase-like Zn-dependent oxidoreductase